MGALLRVTNLVFTTPVTRSRNASGLAEQAYRRNVGQYNSMIVLNEEASAIQYVCESLCVSELEAGSGTKCAGARTKA